MMLLVRQRLTEASTRMRAQGRRLLALPLILVSIWFLVRITALASPSDALGWHALAAYAQFMPLLYVGAYIALPQRGAWLCWAHYAALCVLYAWLFAVGGHVPPSSMSGLADGFWFTMLLSHPCYILALHYISALRGRIRAAQQAAGQDKERFLAMLSHEIRSPLQAMLGSIDLLALKVKEGTAEQRAVNRMRVAATQLDTYLRDVTAFARLENPTWKLNVGPVVLVPLLKDVCDHYQHKAQDKGLSLSLDVCELPADWPIQTDPQRLRQILDNLVSNALKYSEHGTVQVRAALAGVALDEVTIEVQDTGMGIPAEAQDSILEPYVRLDESIDPRIEGTGLGLSIVRTLVERLGGRLSVDSIPDLGSCFRVTFPCNPGLQKRQ